MRKALLYIYLAMMPVLVYGQKVTTTKRVDTVICNAPYRLVHIEKTVSDKKGNRERVNRALVVLKGLDGTDTLLHINNITDAALRAALKDKKAESEAGYSEKTISYDRMGCILEITQNEATNFADAAHGSNTYTKTFFDLESGSYFDLGDVFESCANYVINYYTGKHFAGEPEPYDNYDVSGELDISKGHYSFGKDSLVMEFHYADGFGNVSYMQQMDFVSIPYTELRLFMKKESPVYKYWRSKKGR